MTYRTFPTLRSGLLRSALCGSLCVAGCVAVVDEQSDVSPTAEALTFSDEDWGELQNLHRDAIDRSFADLSHARRLDVLGDLSARARDPHILRAGWTTAGTPRSIVAPGFRIRPEDVGLSEHASPRDFAGAFVRRFASLWGVSDIDIDGAQVTVVRRTGLDADVVTIEYQQQWEDVRVVGGFVRVHVDESENVILGVTGSFLPILGLDVLPVVDESTARSALALAEAPSDPAQLVIWSAYRIGGPPEPHLAWRVLGREGDSVAEENFVDAHTGAVLHRRSTVHATRRRALWDNRGFTGYTLNACSRWSSSGVSWPNELDAMCGTCAFGCSDCTCNVCSSACDSCRTDPTQCALCACRDRTRCDPTDCETGIWRYDDEHGGCAANGDPVGEGACGSQALQFWADQDQMHSYWLSSFGRDSWDGLGGWMWGRLNVTGVSGGQTLPADADNDYKIDNSSANIGPSFAADWLDGHELGHTLQQGLWRTNYFGTTGWGFHATTAAMLENNADMQAYRYDSSAIPDQCFAGARHHYTQLETAANAAAANKQIDGCHAWLMSQSAFPSGIYWYGITVIPTSPAMYDQIWYRALDVYAGPDDDYFDWWANIQSAAFDLVGYGAAYYTALDAADAVGTWNGKAPFSPGLSVPSGDRVPAVGWSGMSRGPCIFQRYSGWSSAIYWRCYTPSGWTSPALFNSPGVDSAVTEPAASFRYEYGKNYVYVAWAAPDHTIRYRRFDVDTFAVGPTQTLTAGGTTPQTNVPVAIAPIYETASLDRLMVVYRPYGTNQYRSTWLGSGAAPAAISGANASTPPSLVSFPYWGRVYFVRPDQYTSGTPYHLRYWSYTLAAGWAHPTNNDLTSLYNTNSSMPTDIVRTDRGVALAEYEPGGAGAKLRMAFVTVDVPPAPSTTRELWYATLAETSSGVLGTISNYYNAVPIAPITNLATQSAGGLAPGPAGYPLHHVFVDEGRKIYDWSTRSD